MGVGTHTDCPLAAPEEEGKEGWGDCREVSAAWGRHPIIPWLLSPEVGT